MPVQNPGRNVIVYVVDDDPSVRRGLSRLMKSADLPVRAFGSAAEFLGSDFGESPGCLVLDVRMPGMDGLELQEKLKSAGSAMPVIFITAVLDENIRDRVMANGALAYFLKPFDGDQLLQSVHEALGKT